MTAVSQEVLEMVAIHGGLGTSFNDIHPSYFFVLDESVARAEEDMAAFDHEGDQTAGLIGFAVIHCSEILGELAEQASRQYQSLDGVS